MNKMLLRRNRYIYLLLAISLFIVAAIVENGLLKSHPEKHLINDFQKQLINNETDLEFHLNHISEIILSDDYITQLNDYLTKNGLLLDEDGVGFLVYKNGELQYWSDRSISFYDQYSEYSGTNGFIKLPNGYYLIKSVQKSDFDIVGLYLVKHNYDYENKYLKNTFFRSYNLPDDYEIITTKNERAYPILDKEGNFLFSIWPNGKYLCTTRQLYFPAIIYLIGLLILLYYFREEFIFSKATFFLKLFVLAGVLFIVYWLHLTFHIPAVFSYLPFFSPDYSASSNWLPSLGDFFFLALFFFFWMYNFAADLDIDDLHENSTLSKKIIIALLVMFAASCYLLVNYYIKILIEDSTISFSFNQITQITAQSVLGIFSIGLFLLANVYFTVKVFELARHDFKLIQVVILILTITLFLAVVQFISIKNISFRALAFFVAISILANLFSKKYLHEFTLSYLIIFVSVTSLYSLIVFYRSINEKDRQIQKLFAVDLVTERDPVADAFLTDIWNKIQSDPIIPDLLSYELTDEKIHELKEHIVQTYFNSYFRKYFIDIYVCYSQNDSLYLEYEDRMVDCVPFFNDLIERQGRKIGQTNFYFMDNMNGRISYAGVLNYNNIQITDNAGVSIFIEINSDLLFEGIGFPELLIDKSKMKPEIFKKFSYAKYNEGELTDMYGNYNYNSYVDRYLESSSDDSFSYITDKEFTFKRWDGMEHLIYHTSEDNYVIVSRKLFTVVDYLISFPYIFVFYFLAVLILLFVGDKSIRKRQIKFDLKFKIQVAIISIVFVSLLLVALVTIYYNIDQYKAKHLSDLDDKMKSISEEIDVSLEPVDEITPELKEWLIPELTNLSNIFRTDINIYGIDGDIIASSRREIFDYGLVSSRINAQAYYEIIQNAKIDFFQPEEIGQLSYLSAYRPIVNNRGKYLGIVNLPYFIKQDNYSQEISTFIVAFINLYVLLFFASIIVAIFISNQITRPLVVIQENLRKMVLGKRNEPIQYDRNDEIGSLVNEYNKKVDELAVSADLLARSERELAWREMAKQIAHEIKNPLTPMKLNIQHLQRASRDGKGFDEYMERVAATLIEQIDNLSNIATEFSNFAKIPTARNQVFVLSELLHKVIDLFEPHDQVKLDFYPNGMEGIEVNADKEQLSRAIINLIKNGIQSIPKERQGKIKIILNRRDYMAVISVSDNGGGIPVELRDKLFSPSFTTKTSGMGLGLAIVKNIVENFSGRIWFETELGKGTTFFLEIPVWEKNDSDRKS